MRWWTWAGARANGTLAAALSAVSPGLVDELDRYDNRYVKLRGDATPVAVAAACSAAVQRFGPDLVRVDVSVSDEALKQLTFFELLPPALAAATLSARAFDACGCRAVAAPSEASVEVPKNGSGALDRETAPKAT